MTVAIVVLVVAWLVVLLGRNHIRARWWAYRLAQTEDLQGQTEYLNRLVMTGDAALPAARWMLRSEDAGVRSFGVVVLNHLGDEGSRQLLFEAFDDPDPDVQRNAILGVARRGSTPELMERLVRMTRASDAVTACLAVVGLAALDTPEATAAMVDLIGPSHPVGVRVQAIESLAEGGKKEAIDSLIECLDDATVFDGMTDSERLAYEAFSKMAGETVGELAIERTRTVGQQATRALQILTGQSFDSKGER